MKRWIFLLFSCLTYFFAEVFIEQSAPLVSRLCGTAAACENGTDNSCLHFTATQFNSLYVVHFWSGGLAALSTGFFLERYGVWLVSCTTAVLLLTGLILFTVGPYFTTTVAYWIMSSGLLLVSTGYFAQVVLSHEVKSHWFMGKELALAFSIYVVSGPLGSIFCMAMMGYLAEQVGLQNTLWITFTIGIFSPICALVAGWVYRVNALISTVSVAKSDEPVRSGFRKLTQLGMEFWILAGIVFTFFGAFLTTLFDFPKLLTELYGYPEGAAGLITGLIPDIAIFTPIIGHLIDKYGRRDILNFIGTGLFFLGYIVLVAVPGYHRLLPVLCCVTMAIAYACLAAAVWSSIPAVTTPSSVGIAMSVGIGLQALASGLTMVTTGIILDQTSLSTPQRWDLFFVPVSSLAGISWLLSGISMYLDWKNPLRPLRAKHTIFAITAEKNPAVEPELSGGYEDVDADEVSPLVGSRETDTSNRKRYSIMSR